MSAVTRLIFRCGVVCGLALLNSGCDKGPQAEFKYRDSTKDLISDAEQSVKKTLKEGFGTPTELVAWERFPIGYGGIKGAVAAIGDDKSIVVKLDGTSAKIRKDAPIVWLTGALAGSKTAEGLVASFNPETNQIKLAKATDQPTAGDRFVIGFGDNLALGRRVYMKNCMHCHGVTGDGAGPTAEFLNPRPRDYRNGEFKFTSTKKGEKATKDDLHRIVQYGIPGTYMPSFLLLGGPETTAVVEYVRWLAVRGEFEKRLTAEMTSDYSKASIADAVEKAARAYEEKKKDKDAEKPPSLGSATRTAAGEFKKYAQEELPAAIEETANLLAEFWNRAEDPETVLVPSVPRVEDTAESRERGRLLYLSDETKCYTCHGMLGRGDGSSTEDFWKDPFTNLPYKKRGLHDIWGNPLKPRNLTLGQYRGGRRPVDIFRRMYVGIKATPMPAFGGNKIKDEQLWDLVNYVMSLPYSSRQPATEAPAKGSVAKLEEKPAH